jgi:hypothetical protein
MTAFRSDALSAGLSLPAVKQFRARARLGGGPARTSELASWTGSGFGHDYQAHVQTGFGGKFRAAAGENLCVFCSAQMPLFLYVYNTIIKI